ncbi:hypothetical protein [Streptacidiphilus albus]|uniref:hypothetical protein n=1 Tax=Streptacidiphilus albus TaxID=105425 RepID=UPI00054BF6FB|nr:hypothetical protein [Streptacidiphilus albus]
MANTTIQVPAEVRDHLAVLAAERGMTIGQLVGALSAREPTAEQLAARVAATRAALRANSGCALTDEEFDQAPPLLERVYRIAAAEARKRLPITGDHAA